MKDQFVDDVFDKLMKLADAHFALEDSISKCLETYPDIEFRDFLLWKLHSLGWIHIHCFMRGFGLKKSEIESIIARKNEEASQARMHDLETMPYPKYLKTPEWQQRRYIALERAGYRCQVCNASNVQLNTHHRTYERRGHELDSDLITLCQDCHYIFHENGRLAQVDYE